MLTRLPNIKHFLLPRPPPPPPPPPPQGAPPPPPLRPPLDPRIRLLQPFGHLLGILPVGLPHRLLRCEAPPLQILAHGANRQSNADLTLDQLLHGLSGPERRRDLHLLRSLGLDRLLDASLLLPVEEATGADRSPGAITGEGLLTSSLIPGTPPGDRLLSNSQDGGDINHGVTQLPRMPRTQPQGVEDVIGLTTSIG